MGYEFEVFLSYRRSLANGRPSAEREWVQDIFFPELERRFAVCHPQARIFLDTELETGVQWPEALKQGLLRSRFLLPVWSAGYFTSAWCMTEWDSMRAREEQLGLGRDGDAGLVFPVVFGDGRYFPEAAQNTQWRPFHEFSRVTRRKTKVYEKLRAELDDLCDSIARRIDDQCPPFADDFPIREGTPLDPSDIPPGSMR